MFEFVVCVCLMLAVRGLAAIADEIAGLRGEAARVADELQAINEADGDPPGPVTTPL